MVLPGFGAITGGMITLIATVTMIFTFGLMILNLKTVARDTVDALRSATVLARENGRLLPNVAFLSLWVIIFALSFG